MFQEITHVLGNLCSSRSITLAEDLSYGSTSGSLERPDGRHFDWVILGKFIVGEGVSWGPTPKLLLISTNSFSFLFLFFLFLSLVIICLFVFFFFFFFFFFLNYLPSLTLSPCLGCFGKLLICFDFISFPLLLLSSFHSHT